MNTKIKNEEEKLLEDFDFESELESNYEDEENEEIEEIEENDDNDDEDLLNSLEYEDDENLLE